MEFTHENILALVGPELSRAMAERVMGCRAIYMSGEDYYRLPNGSVMHHEEWWEFDKSRDDCHAAYLKLTAEQQERYGAALAELVGIQLITGISISYDDIAAIAEADCETRCRAMLCAILET